MISQEHKDLARWAMKYALSKGCSDARISVYSGTNNSFDYRDTQLEKLEQSSENGMSIQLYVDGRYASYSTNRLDKNELERFIANGIEATRFLAKDEFRQLPKPERYYKGDGKGLEIYDYDYSKVSVDDKMALIKENAAEVYGKDERLISVTASYSDGISSSFMITSNGFEGESDTTYYSISADTSMKGAGDSRPQSYWYDSAVFWDKLEKKNIGKIAYERTVRKLGQEKIASGVFPMLVDNTQITRLLSPIIAAIYGNAIQQKNSFLIDKIGEKIISDKFTLTDDPHISGARGSRWFDGEGVATKKRTVIENGVLKMYYIDTYSGLKLNMEPTIQGPSLLNCVHGNKNFDQLLASVEKGIWITGFNGGNSNSTTGDFSFGIEGFLIENGKAIKPLNEMNITGNLLELWKNVIEVGNDPKMNSSWRIPSILFDKVSFSGK
ncbi:MAG: TldD/PmbA family protein [Dysgonamonadaceae bacterium]|jgi:PmbA protein|nr:TldD/PmbA family protein [Dysgonamonadaceae bacterium]